MPRAKATPGMNQVAPGETYGERQELEAMIDAQPMPDRRMASDGDLQMAATQTAGAMSPQIESGGVLGRASSRPKEPITAGLGRGAGPGPEALQMPTRQQDKLRQQLATAAEITHNPTIMKMAENARRPIGQKLSRRP